MRVTSCEILRLQLPFRSAFRHAAAERSASDTILVVLEDETGHRGFGEILARSYVTGETNEEIFTAGAPELGAEVVGQRFESQAGLVAFLLAQLQSERWQPALFGGFEAALINLQEQSVRWDFAAILGPRRKSVPGRCFTIGLEVSEESIRRCARQARLVGATVTKVKVGGKDDGARLHLLNECWRGSMPLRLDGNGALSVDGARALLEACTTLPLQSFEQPFSAGDPDLTGKLRDLYAGAAVPLVADESVCRLSDARRWAGSGAYHVFNIRVGKCGGLLASSKIMDLARAHAIGLVGGSMVGESAVLRHVSGRLLLHNEDLPYVEGLEQNRALLACEPAEVISGELSGNGATRGSETTFRLREEVRDRFLVACRRIDS
jgi:L-alanine-DL-glutamate epimerase-like enolase superfamily enzyme